MTDEPYISCPKHQNQRIKPDTEHHTPRLQTMLQSESNQNSVVQLTNRHRPTEQIWEPRNKPAYTWSNNFLAKKPKAHNGQKSIFNKWCWEKWKGTWHWMKLDCCLSLHAKLTQNESKT